MDKAETEAPQSGGVKRWLPLAVLVVAGVAAYIFRVDRYVNYHALVANREWLLGEVAALGAWAPIAFIAIYTAVAALSFPGALWLSLTGGFLFGTVLGGFYNLISATIGATFVFLVARTAYGEALRRRAGPALQKVEAGLRENATSYLLVLRLIPVFPFVLVNLVAALFGMSLRAYVVCSFFGMMPGALVYASLGAGLGSVLDRGEKPNLHIVFEPHVLLPLIGLSLLALAPVLYRYWKRPT